jgi:capsular polysaccharide export protein
MQMQGDYQVRRASGYGRLDAMIEDVTASFARHAPPRARLVFKLHPLENGLRDWPRAIARAAARHGLADRVETLDGGDLGRLLDGAAGAVTLNSTAGLEALRRGVPVATLGIAVYAMAGTTHQGPLDAFWRAPPRPCAATVAAMLRLMRASIQVKGNFFTPEGRAAGVEGAAGRLLAGTVNGHGAFADPPPRLARARAMGVPEVFGD